MWISWCQRWRETTIGSPERREHVYYNLLKVGRWLAATHPDVVSPQHWTRELAAEFVAAVNDMRVGQWIATQSIPLERMGKPLSARSKDYLLGAMRTFLYDAFEWDWAPRRFDPYRCLATPRSVRNLIGPDPRVIQDDSWAKLLWAGLNLTGEDLPCPSYRNGSQANPGEPWYPLEMVRAMVVVWLFTGLRRSEFRRLRVGCIQWQREEITVHETGETIPKDAICWLRVPIHKTGTAFTKGVDRVVGEAIMDWEQIRPQQPSQVDPKTGEIVDFLFSYRGIQVGETYLNHSLIPLLCRKGGVPLKDARGNITSHRARSTIASQLFNAREPMSLFELQEWLGHRWASSTQSYAKLKPTKVAKSYEKAGYFARNVRAIEVLIDQDVVKSGAAASGVPWRYFDLGHGYCTYDFFDQCPHRMACARCSFYLPKESSQAQLLEGKVNLQRLLQEIPLTEEERAAIEDGITAMEKLCQQLADKPTPAGPTPRELEENQPPEMQVIPLKTVRRSSKTKEE